ncbi:MAG: hypothetical protein LBJ25_00550, partial [Candidatus Margulisbacteria bacterium]|nr:hypothetical protein [Candidatus Margulisiibacteriota bacterium]
MFCKNIAAMFGDYYSSGPAARNFADKPARWSAYVDGSGTEHIQVGGLYWDEAQIKAQGKGDYTQHFILNAYQGISEQEKDGFRNNGYPLPNLLAVGDKVADGQDMLDEFICFAENLQYYGGFRPEIILMN